MKTAIFLVSFVQMFFCPSSPGAWIHAHGADSRQTATPFNVADFRQQSQRNDEVTLVTGEKIRGTILEIVPGKYVRMKTLGGVTRSFKWSTVKNISQVPPEKPVVQKHVSAPAETLAVVPPSGPPGKSAVRKRQTRRGFFLSGGYCVLSFTTDWYYETPNYLYAGRYYYYYPEHLLDRSGIDVALGYQSLFSLGPVHIDLELDLDYGLTGGTKEGSLTPSDQISSGG